jgi:TPR repeat protein
MNYIKKLSLFTLCLFFSNYAFSVTINQKTWSAAINNKDSVAQYQLAWAYNPLDKNDDFECLPHQFYLISNNKKLAGCHDKSADKYIEFLTKSAKNLYPLAQKDLGIAYIEGKLVAKDIKQGLYWLQKAASPISPKATFSVGEGTLWLNKTGRKHGVGEAQYILGTLYNDGVDVKADYNKAIMYYEMASKSYDWRSDGTAQYQLYQLYKNKINDPKKELYWLEQAATRIKYNKAFDIPMKLVEYFLSGGQIDGSKSEQPNYLWASKWLVQFIHYEEINKENRQKMLLQLAWHYLNGLGIKKDLQAAAKYYHLGMTINPYVDIPPSNKQMLQNQFLLNVIQPLYENKLDLVQFYYSEHMEQQHPNKIKMKKDKINNKNQSYADKASNIMNAIFADNLKDEEKFYIQLDQEMRNQYYYLDDSNFSRLLTLMQNRGMAYGFYREADNIKYHSIDELIALYQSALKLEPTNPAILYRFGTLYDFIINDVNTAISYYKQAADLGYTLANYRLGVLYYLGKGVPQNYHEAWQYLNLAAQQQYKPAQNFLIAINKSHPEFNWLTTQYIDHPQNYYSPTVIVDGEDWLKQQYQTNPTSKIIYHFTKHNVTYNNPFRTDESCKAAIELATDGDTAVQQDFITQLIGNNLTCIIKQQELMFSWIDNSHSNDQQKQFLKAKYYQLTKQEKQYRKQLNYLANNQNEYAIINLLNYTRLYYDARDSNYLSQLKKLLKSGNTDAVELLMRYYGHLELDSSLDSKRRFQATYQYTKARLLKNDLIGFISDGLWGVLKDQEYVYANSSMLSSADIYKIWFELADMHEQGVDIPQNNVFAYVWYSLLAEHHQDQAANKVQELKAQLTTEQLTEATNKLAQYSKSYQFLPLIRNPLDQK